MKTLELINPTILKRFLTLKKNNRLGHAYLFVGPNGVGKIETALEIAKLVIDEKATLDSSGFVKADEKTISKIESGNHPDVHILQSESGESIKIEQIRQLITALQLRPFESEKKMVIVENIENLTIEGANALLKTLEEPSDSNVIILTTSVPEKVMDTVKSRCQLINFQSLHHHRLADILNSQYKIKKQEAHFLSSFSDGSLGEAIRLHEKELFDRKNFIIDHFVFSSGFDAYVKELAADKEVAREALTVMLSWIRDLILVKAGVEDQRIIHIDRKNDLRSIAANFMFSDFKELSEMIVTTRHSLNENLNIKVPLSLIREKAKSN